jgi:large subunit ribosomal protein L31
MREGIHPKYDFVIFRDTSANWSMLTRSTRSAKETMKWEDGNEYPVLDVDISSASHPFYTGKQKLVDTAGRIEKFKRKYEKKS